MANTFYSSAGLSISKLSSTTPAAGVNTFYSSAGLEAEALNAGTTGTITNTIAPATQSATGGSANRGTITNTTATATQAATGGSANRGTITNTTAPATQAATGTVDVVTRGKRLAFNPFTGTFDWVQNLDGYLPYVGASANVNLNTKNLKTAGKSTLGEIQSSGDLYFVGAGSGVPYGGIYAYDESDEITIASSGIANKVQVTTFNVNGGANLTTPDHTQAHIVVEKSGVYAVSLVASIESVAGGAGRFGFGIFKNNGATQFQNLHAHSQLGGGGAEYRSIAITGHASFTAGDTVEFWVYNDTTTANIIFDDVNLNIHMLGGAA